MTGEFTGAYAIHPFTKKKLPIWTADYVLSSYGSGAIMSVPCGDQRDWLFATKFKITIINIFKDKNISKRAYTDKDAILYNSDFLNGLTTKTAEQLAIKELAKNNYAEPKTQYKLRDAVFSRQRYWGEPFPVYYKGATIVIKDLIGLESSSAGAFIGIVLSLLVGIIIIGGIKRIASVTEKIVPFMAVLYLLACLYIIVINFSLIDDAFSLIFSQAFNPEAIGVGGIIGVLLVGFKRAAFSNEAGAGSASIAHSAVKTKYSASEGLVALLEPFIDTVVICTMTALVIIIFNFVEYKLN